MWPSLCGHKTALQRFATYTYIYNPPSFRRPDLHLWLRWRRNTAGGPATLTLDCGGLSSLSCKHLTGSINSDTPSNRRDDIKHKGAGLFGWFTSQWGRAETNSPMRDAGVRSSQLFTCFYTTRLYYKDETGCWLLGRLISRVIYTVLRHVIWW